MLLNSMRNFYKFIISVSHQTLNNAVCIFTISLYLLFKGRMMWSQLHKDCNNCDILVIYKPEQGPIGVKTLAFHD